MERYNIVGYNYKHIVLGNYQPSDGQSCPTGSCTCRHPIDSSILLSFIISALVLSAGIIVSVLLQFVNYRWRNNK